MRRVLTVIVSGLVIIAALGAFPCLASEPVAFRQTVLTEDFHTEAAAIGDIDRNVRGDAVYGLFWYAGPDFTKRHPIYAARATATATRTWSWATSRAGSCSCRNPGRNERSTRRRRAGRAVFRASGVVYV